MVPLYSLSEKRVGAEMGDCLIMDKQRQGLHGVYFMIHMVVVNMYGNL